MQVSALDAGRCDTVPETAVMSQFDISVTKNLDIQQYYREYWIIGCNIALWLLKYRP